MTRYIKLCFVLATALCFSYCSSDKDEVLDPGGNNDPCATVPAKFAANIAPIIETKCALGSACHGEGSTNGVGPLLTFDHAKSGASRIKAAVMSGAMPKNGSLTQAQINSIRCWVDGGALNN